MTSAEERIKELARAQSLDAADEARLLDAVRPSSSGRPGHLSNPFERWSGETTSLLGAVVALAGLATSRLGVRYDGAIDLHVTRGAVPIGVAVLDQVLAVGLTSLVMWGAARFVSRARFVDVLGAVGLSRAPAVLVAVPLAFLVPLLPTDPSKFGAAAHDIRLLVIVGIIAVVAIAGVVAQIWALVLGFRTATGARGGRLALSLIGGLFAAEIVVKLVLALAR
ncbi:MAG: hypothetical protein JWO86_1186 [Myxococcaceae bacterium]|nr:hypothetical protein [Myxococcaceae bacterium]